MAPRLAGMMHMHGVGGGLSSTHFCFFVNLLGDRVKSPEFKVGDKVSHRIEEGNVGEVVAVRSARWPFRYWIYDVQWREGVLPVPMREGLWQVQEKTVTIALDDRALPEDSGTDDAAQRTEPAATPMNPATNSDRTDTSPSLPGLPDTEPDGNSNELIGR